MMTAFFLFLTPMHRHFKKIWIITMVLAVFAQPVRAEKIILEYWDKWAGLDGPAMENAVKGFNASQDRIEVRYTAISQIDVKLMLAIAGRHPPDIAGLFTSRLYPYIDNNALLPLDVLAEKAGIKKEDYLPIIWDMCHYRGHLWALPTTPLDEALCWNKRLFREAGLDPNKAPRTIAEFEEYNEKISKPNPDGKSYKIFGHLPSRPWWHSQWGFWFGGRLWDGESRITATDEGNRLALEWIASYPKRFGLHQILAFTEGGSNAGTSTATIDPFLQERVAMEMCGPWIADSILKYASKQFELGVAPFPTLTGQGPPVTAVESDIITIPVGSKHVREAFEFICYVNQQKVMEKLCSEHCQFSPLSKVSDAFWKNHPNPYIRTFYDLASSPGAQPLPQTTVWYEYDKEFNQAIQEVWALRLAPDVALKQVQERIQPKLDQRVDRWKNLQGKLDKIWTEEENNP